VKHLDLKKSLRYQQSGSVPQPAPNTTQANREDQSASMTPSINSDITILSLCSCPDVAFESAYTPPGDRPEGVTMEQWRHSQTNAAGSKYVRASPHFNYKPTICLLTSLGLTVLIDVEVCYPPSFLDD
jgi:hypothetical protein